MSLQRRILKRVHETHVGIVRTKQLLRLRYFWVGMDKAMSVRLRTARPALQVSH